MNIRTLATSQTSYSNTEHIVYYMSWEIIIDPSQIVLIDS